MERARRKNVLNLLLGILPKNDLQYQRIGNSIHATRVLLRGLLQS